MSYDRLFPAACSLLLATHLPPLRGFRRCHPTSLLYIQQQSYCIARLNLYKVRPHTHASRETKGNCYSSSLLAASYSQSECNT